jgi:hypothetical protein
MSTKGSGPRKGHNAEKQRKNYDDIDWSKKPAVQKMHKSQKSK